MNRTIILEPDRKQYLMNSLKHAMAEPKPHQVIIKPFVEKRLDAQNKLYHHWNREIAEQRDDMDVIDVLAHNKLNYGVPIRCTDCDDYRQLIGPFLAQYTREKQIKIMETDLIAVTRDMTVKQMCEFLNRIELYWSSQGVKLTTDDDRYFEAMGYLK